MLNQHIDITEAKPPFLLSNADGSWHLVISLAKLEADNYELTCVQKQNDTLNQYKKSLSEPPFHVAENIWELGYGSEIKTLLDETLKNHAASDLWSEWCTHKQDNL